MSKSLVEIAKEVMTLEESDISPKINSLIESGLVETTDKQNFISAYKKLRIGGVETKLSEQERIAMKNLVVTLLESVDKELSSEK